ncbi:hypothetical protein F2P81_007633 [Scophthalmus maximus]|uniref:Uncharacterized protein n=1 Tax=Scophthalmus maximus TaxID=52904 RepID=A0A6A4T4Y8_SCOMX|nr:hypothetical protein F2P81_007633 [Scophthalmus maximus]
MRRVQTPMQAKCCCCFEEKVAAVVLEELFTERPARYCASQTVHRCDPLKQLKDLTQLKSQLEEIQRRVENEVSVGIPQGGSLLGSPFLKGFLAGYVVAKLRSSAVLGVLLGTITGMFVAQNYQVPNIEKTVKEYLNNARKGP